MPGFVALPGVFQAWRNTLGAHIALVMSGTVIFFMALASGLGYLNAVQLAAQKHEQAMELQLVEHSREVRTILDGFATQLRSYSHSTVISSTLIDSEGRERHIRPFLELAGESLRQAFGAVQSPTPGAPVIGVPRLAVLDHRGTVLAQSTRTAENYQSASWLKTVMNGAPFAAVDGRELLVAYPILLPSTGLPEGIVVGRVDIGALFGTTAEVSIGGALWRAGVAAEMAHWAGAPDMLVRTSTLGLAAPLDSLGLQAGLAFPRPLIRAEALALAWPYLALLVLALPVVGTVGYFVGRRLARPIETLAQQAKTLEMHTLEDFAHAARVGSGISSEVSNLSQSLRAALQRIGSAQEAIARLAQIVEHANDAVISTDPDGFIETCNPAAERLFGLAQAEILGQSILALMPTTDTADESQGLGPDKDFSVPRVLHITGNGGEKNVDVVRSSVRNPQGQLVAYAYLVRDMTQQEALEQQLRESQKLEAIGQLTGGLAHDFNNLLGIIIGNLDLVGETAGLTDKPQRRLQTALDAALRGAEITRSLLAVARRQPLRVQAQDLNAVVREMRPLIESSAGKAVALSLDLCAGELTVPLDAGGLSNALLNLVNNARDAMAQGQTTEPQLTVRTRRLALHGGADAALPAGDYGVLEVLDTGPGMPEAVRERVFEPFYTTKEMGKGTGLGLSMVRGFAEQLGGTARIESEPGAGTTVRIILPVGMATKDLL